MEKVVLVQQANRVAKFLLLNYSCEDCNHYKFGKCESILRARNEKNIRHIETIEWRNFKENGLNIPKEKVCQYWE